jgi:hypothetical protein
LPRLSATTGIVESDCKIAGQIVVPHVKYIAVTPKSTGTVVKKGKKFLEEDLGKH